MPQPSTSQGFCRELVEVLELPTTLLSLDWQECSTLEKITGFSALAKLQFLNISGCKELAELPVVERLSYLMELRAFGCQKLMSIRSWRSLLYGLSRTTSKPFCRKNPSKQNIYRGEIS